MENAIQAIQYCLTNSAGCAVWSLCHWNCAGVLSHQLRRFNAVESFEAVNDVVDSSESIRLFSAESTHLDQWTEQHNWVGSLMNCLSLATTQWTVTYGEIMVVVPFPYKCPLAGVPLSSMFSLVFSLGSNIIPRYFTFEEERIFVHLAVWGGVRVPLHW